VANQTGRSFGSDNHAGVHPSVLAAIAAANEGDAVAYGQDDGSQAAVRKLCDAAGAREAYLVFNGTAANLLGLSFLLRPYEAVICADTSHLNVDECGAAERLLGCKLLPVPTPDGKLTPELIETRLTGLGDEHRAQPRVVQIAQVTEVGTCYTLAELDQISEYCRANGLRIYVDGARLANAAAFLDCSLTDIASRVDVLSFGGTKNGALGVEAVLVMADGLDDGGPYQRKQLLQLASKMRFLAAQVSALLDQDLWLANARHANTMAQRLAAEVIGVDGIQLAYPVESNGVFAEIGERQATLLQRDWNFHVWAQTSPGRCVVRWMTAYDSTAEQVDALASAVKESGSFT